MQGFQKRIEAQYQLFAWHASNIMNCWATKGKGVTPDQLLGKKKEMVSKEDVMDRVRQKSRNLKMKKQEELLKDARGNTDDILDEERTDFASFVLRSTTA